MILLYVHNIQIIEDLGVNGDEKTAIKAQSIPSDINQSERPTLENEYDHNDNRNPISSDDNLSLNIRREHEFPLKIIFLIQQINLQQKLRTDGVMASLAYADSDRKNFGKLIIQTTTADEAYISDQLLQLWGCVDHCDSLSERICQYFIRNNEFRDSINQKFQQLNMDAGIAYINQTISVIATNPDSHRKAIKALEQAFDSSSTKLIIKDSYYSQNMDMFLSMINQNIPQSSSLWSEVVLSNKPCNYILTVTGPRQLVSNAIKISKQKEHDYGVISISINGICILKTEYLRLYRKHDISAIEKKYNCQIKVETLKDNEEFTSKLFKAITVKCRQLNKVEINRQVNEIIKSIIIEKEDPVSFHSRIGRFCHCGKNKSKLEDLQEKYECLLVPTDRQGRRYVEIYI